MSLRASALLLCALVCGVSGLVLVPATRVCAGQAVLSPSWWRDPHEAHLPQSCWLRRLRSPADGATVQAGHRSHMRAGRRLVAPAVRAPLLSVARVPVRAASPLMIEKVEVGTPHVETSISAAEEVKRALLGFSLSLAAAVAFAFGVFMFRGGEDATAWAAAYILEESLSVDNLFVFSLIFDYFRTPTNAQPRVLAWGLIAAVVLRAVFILAGIAVVERFKIALVPCGLLLLYSAYAIVTEGDEDEDLSENAIVQFTRKYLPSTDEYAGDRFFLKSADGSTLATPLLLALVCVELSDVLFAVDSVPAVFGVTTDPFIAFTSNAFAILGLRQLYTLIAEGMENLEYLRPSIAGVLAFIGAKLLLGQIGLEVSTTSSLLVVAGSLGVGIGASVLFGTSEEGAAEAEEEAPASRRAD
uniref:Uncharacterized protein n=1 Tax=Calcidiscus leptoporus TaxID=127549 RepID=A0A7S0ISE3_9EUKA|mmetsp:Transcript_20394/g.47084  ORF Transcript_20394/g.47084 Transcript_20394/m.47084 type:complete len:414 (+) Transcript_20394:46-1287(+)